MKKISSCLVIFILSFSSLLGNNAGNKYANRDEDAGSTTNTYAAEDSVIVTFTGYLYPQCESSTGYTLTGGMPNGGTYSGPGVTGSYFNPSVAGSGTHIITYTYMNGSGVSGSATNTIIVYPLPVVTWSNVLPPQCISSTACLLTGVYPTGGTCSGPGVTVSNFNASLAGIGTHTFTYTYIDGNGCTNSTTNTIIVNPLPVVTWNNVLTDQCISSTTYSLIGGFPAGGTYSGPGIAGNVFNASLAGVGTHTLTYTYKDGNMCINSTTNTITVNALPVVSFNIVLPTQCISSTTLLLTGGTPAGGIYSGPGVTGNNFNATLAGIGTHTLNYTYISSSGCINQSTSIITVTSCSDLTGVLSYDNSAQTPMNNCIVMLMQNGVQQAQTTTNSSGSYLFTNVPTGDYTLEASTTKPWGGCNANDGLLILKSFVGMVSLTGTQLNAADLDASGYINSSDGLLVVKRFVNFISSFVTGDWYFEKPAVTITGIANETMNIHARCYGDVDGSFVPVSK